MGEVPLSMSSQPQCLEPVWQSGNPSLREVRAASVALEDFGPHTAAAAREGQARVPPGSAAARCEPRTTGVRRVRRCIVVVYVPCYISDELWFCGYAI